VFELYPRHSHRTPQQIAEDASGSFEPRRANHEQDAANPERASSGGVSTTAMQKPPVSNRPSDQLKR
jgi:hypothetical protein